MRRLKWGFMILLCFATAVLSGCSVLGLQGDTVPNRPNLQVLSMPEYQEQESLSSTTDTHQGHFRVDLWLDGSQVMGGVNASKESLYPHYNRRYREGGFHYRYENQVGMYENVLRDALSASEGLRVRLLRYGNERLPDSFLISQGLAKADASPDALRSLRRDLLTYAIDPMPSLLSTLSAENMEGGFYSLGTPKLNQMAVFMDDNGGLLENPGMAQAMSAALDAQIAAIASDSPGALTATGNDTDYPLLYALSNIDLTRLSVITCDPAGIRRLTGAAADGSPVRYLEDLLRERGVFDSGLCAGLYAFTLDYMGQITSFEMADFSEPVIWGRLKYNTRTNVTEAALPMPRVLLMLVVGMPAHVEAFTSALEQNLNANPSLKGLRGGEEGSLSYAVGGETIVQQPFSFSYEYTSVTRPSMGYYTQHTNGVALAVTEGEGKVSQEGSLQTATLSSDQSDRQENRVLTLTFPVQAPPGGIGADLTLLQNVRVDVVSALLLSKTLPNTQETQALLPEDGINQVVALRDTLYVFEHRASPFEAASSENPFTISSIAPSDGDALIATIAVDGAKLQPGYYRLRVCADFSGEQISWLPVDWIDGPQSLNVSVTNEQRSAWESFSALITEYDRDAKTIPKQFQHAWGPATTKAYHGATIPDCPPFDGVPGLTELLSQLQNAANVEVNPYIRCVADVFVTGGASDAAP